MRVRLGWCADCERRGRRATRGALVESIPVCRTAGAARASLPPAGAWCWRSSPRRRCRRSCACARCSWTGPLRLSDDRYARLESAVSGSPCSCSPSAASQILGARSEHGATPACSATFPAPSRCGWSRGARVARIDERPAVDRRGRILARRTRRAGLPLLVGFELRREGRAPRGRESGALACGRRSVLRDPALWRRPRCACDGDDLRTRPGRLGARVSAAMRARRGRSCSSCASSRRASGREPTARLHRPALPRIRSWCATGVVASCVPPRALNRLRPGAILALDLGRPKSLWRVAASPEGPRRCACRLGRTRPARSPATAALVDLGAARGVLRRRAGRRCKRRPAGASTRVVAGVGGGQVRCMRARGSVAHARSRSSCRPRTSTAPSTRPPTSACRATTRSCTCCRAATWSTACASCAVRSGCAAAASPPRRPS